MILIALLSCSGDAQDSAEPILGPVIDHTPPAGPFLVGDDILIELDADDDQGVGGVIVTFRTRDGAFWSSVELTESEEGTHWSGTIPGDEVEDPGLEYYIKATDLGDIPGVSYLPEDIDQPFDLDVGVVGAPLPFLEDFEAPNGEDLYNLGWANDSAGFPGYVWELGEARAYSGDTSVVHDRGVEGVSPLDDWLISPAIDLSSVDQVQLTFWEYGQGSEFANHVLYASTGSRLPDDGDFVEVAVLEAPVDDTWTRSTVVDLTDFAGSQAVYLAWRYQGEYADDWYIDEVSVRGSTIDLDSEISWSPDPVRPGEATTLSLSMVNTVELSGAALTVSLELPEGAGVLDSETVTTEAVGAGATVVADFELEVDAGWPDNAYLPLVFTVDDGADTWVFEHDMVVGLPSEGRVELSVLESALVQVELGVGDPDDPVWSEQVYSELTDAGAVEVLVDLTDRHESLPPGPGELRWWTRITAGTSGTVDAFEIDHDETTWFASDLPVLTAGDEAFIWLPEPPDPVLTDTDTDPAQLSPGDSASLELTLRNDGAETAGSVSAELVTSDASVTVTDGGPFVLSAGAWEGGDLLTASGFDIEISPDHLDSSSLALSLELDDGVESWSVPVTLEVPWPVLKVTGVEIDDGDDGDDDGLLEPGETAVLDIDLTNVGDMDTSGIVRATPSIGSGSTASATTTGEQDTMGSMSVGTTRTAEVELTVDAGASLGDTVIVELTMVDSDQTYTTELELVLGELPWLSVSPSNDPVGDALGYSFDFVNASYRADDTNFELMVESDEPYDSSAFVEMWCVASSADYSFYRLVYQSGTAKLQGYDGGFVKLDEPTITTPSSTEIGFSWDPSVMGMNSTSMACGFGSGWCGSETGSFCDHFPDGWGYYYNATYYTYDFYTVKW